METVEAQWAAYVAKLRESGTFSSALAIADVSGSMSGTPMNVRGLSSPPPDLFPALSDRACYDALALLHTETRICQAAQLSDVYRVWHGMCLRPKISRLTRMP